MEQMIFSDITNIYGINTLKGDIINLPFIKEVKTIYSLLNGEPEWKSLIANFEYLDRAREVALEEIEKAKIKLAKIEKDFDEDEKLPDWKEIRPNHWTNGYYYFTIWENKLK